MSWHLRAPAGSKFNLSFIFFFFFTVCEETLTHPPKDWVESSKAQDPSHRGQVVFFSEKWLHWSDNAWEENGFCLVSKDATSLIYFLSPNETKYRSSLVAQWGKDLVLSLQWLRSLLWCECDSWPGNFHSHGGQKKKKEKRKKNWHGSSYYGSPVMNPTSIREHSVLTPGFAQWVGDPALLRAMV